MKTARFVLKVVALALATAAAVCTVIAFWENISEGVGCCMGKLRARRQYAEGYVVDEDEDYADWDE